MAVKKEDVIKKAEELGLTLSDDQVNAYVTIGDLPVKQESDSPPDDKGDDDSASDKDKGAQKRIKQLVDQKNEYKYELERYKAQIAELDKAKENDERAKLEAKGEYEKLLVEAEQAKKKALDVIELQKNKTKEMGINAKIESALVKEGVPADRINDALALFPVSKVEFDWTDEDKLLYSIGEIEQLVKDFKESKGYFFTGNDGNNNGDGGFDAPRSPNFNSSPTGKQKQTDRLKGLFSSLR